MRSLLGSGSSVRRASAALLSFACFAGCSLTIDADRKQCSTDDDCNKDGFQGQCVASICERLKVETPEEDAAPVDTTWACLGKTPKPTSSDPGPFSVTFQITDIVSKAAQVGVHGKLCQKLDPDCAAPLNSTDYVSDDKGDMVMQVPRAFSGYVWLQGGTMTDGLYYFNPPIAADNPAVPVQAVTKAIVGALTSGLGSPQEEDRGLTLVNVFNCDETAGVGVTFETENLDDKTTIFYSVKGLPVKDATTTDSAGYGGVVNLKPGNVTIRGTVDEGKKNVGTISILIKPNSITYSRLVPDGT